MLDSAGPGQKVPDEVVALLDSFDLWAMNAPNAPGAACMTLDEQRICNRTVNDYSLAMKVQSGTEVRVQRYTGLDKSTAHPAARALGDFVLGWARKREARGPVAPPG